MADSYIPLYRKYRPQRLSDLVGQEAIARTLKNAFELNKIAHAYLFTGPRGTGKTSTARIFAKSLNCVEGPTISPCGKCPSCLDIANGNAIDVIEIDAASNRKVEDARNLLEKVQFVPVSGKYKVYIIDEVHMLTTEAFNTLLKTLEEPPKNLVFVLATTEAHKVLTTIISRCQRFDFRRIKQDAILGRLREICALESVNISDNALNLIARRSGGGLRDALSLLDQASVLNSQDLEISDSDIMSLLGSLNIDSLLEIVDTLADKNTTNLIKVINNIISLGSEPIQVIRELMNYFRNLLLVKTSGSVEEIASLIDISEQYFDNLKEQADKFEIIEMTQIIEKLSDYQKTLKTTSQQHLWLEVALIGICHRHEITLIQTLEERISKLEEIIQEGKPIHVNNARPAKLEYAKPEAIVKSQPTPLSAPVQKPVEALANQELRSVDLIEEDQVEKNIDETIIEKLPVSQAEEISPVSSPRVSGGNIQNDWKSFLESIESIPSRMFFSNLAKPLVISRDKIVIAFKIESFAKQAQEKSKYDPFEKAAKKFFGAVPKIITMRTILPEDDELVKKTVSSGAKVSTSVDNNNLAPAQSSQKKHQPAENYEQISQDLEEVTVSTKLNFTEAQDSSFKNDENIDEYIDSANREVLPLAVSEQAKLVIDLFNGKVIE